jgi:hypothetical protein
MLSLKVVLTFTPRKKLSHSQEHYPKSRLLHHVKKLEVKSMSKNQSFVITKLLRDDDAPLF